MFNAKRNELESLINESINLNREQYQFLKKEKRRIEYKNIIDRFSEINFKKKIKYSMACIATIGIIAGFYMTKTYDDYAPKIKSYYSSIINYSKGHLKK